MVDLLYQQFYSGSKYPPTLEEQESMRRLFTSEPYVKSEYQYHRITNKGNVDNEQIHENWTSYLEEYKVYDDNSFCVPWMFLHELNSVTIRIKKLYS